MWILALAVYYLFYRFAFLWYLTLWGKENPLDKPPAWSNKLYHVGVIAIAVLLLSASSFLFYLSNSWLVPIPILLALLSFPFYFRARRVKMTKIIVRAVEIQLRMEDSGIPQSKINRSILRETTGGDFGGEIDSNLKSLVKYWILSPLGLYQPSADMNRTHGNFSMGDQIDSWIDSTTCPERIGSRNRED